MKRTGAQTIWEALVAEGVDVVFGYPGGAIMPTYDALPQYPVRHVLVRHEQGAAHMADGYARASGRVGVAIATSGPGATNLVTGIATAMMDSSPVVFITGQVSSTVLGTDAFQETDITGVTLPITKHNYLVTRVEDVYPTIREAFHLARSGRPGPVLVDITKDAQQASLEFEHAPAPRRPRKAPGHPPPEERDLASAAALIEESERPLVFAGQGVQAGDASTILREFVEKGQLPVACTLLGLGAFPSSHPLCMGMMGMHGEAWVNRAVQEADLLIAVGMRFDDRVTGNLRTYAVNARKIHIEIDPSEINKNVRVDVPLCGEAAAILSDLLPRVRNRERRAWLDHLHEMSHDTKARDIVAQPHEDEALHAAHVMHDLWQETGGKALIITDVGQHQMWEAQYYRHEQTRQLITSGGLGTMGFALPAGLGARFARPDADIWVIAGDGGFQMTACELATCAQEDVKLNVAIINNGYLGMVRQWQEFFYSGRYVATPIRSPDFVKLAEAHGLTGLRATTRAEAREAMKRARSLPGTVVVDFRVVPEDSVYPMVPANADLRDMIRRPAPKFVDD
jgi:acetolactate synthase I/II/III large subunit